MTGGMGGLLFTLALGGIAYGLGSVFDFIGGPIFAVVMGMALHPLSLPAGWNRGVALVSKRFLKVAVVCLGFGLELSRVISVGKTSLLLIVATISTALLLSALFYRLTSADKEVTILVAVGSAICGGSAIAATAPVIDAKEEEIATGISVIFLFNIFAALLFPPLGMALGLSHEGFGLWAGTAINDTSSVVAAAQVWAARTGSDVALEYATIVKLTRTLGIIPITLALGFMGRKKKGSSGKSLPLIPPFLLLFLAASLGTTLFPLPRFFLQGMKFLSKFLITTAMGAIGLQTDFPGLLKKGKIPMIQGLICWIAIIVVSLALQKYQGLW